MFHVSPDALDEINVIIDAMFDRMSHQLLGNIPALQGKKIILFSTQPHSNLPNLFIQALGQRAPTKSEEKVLKNTLSNAHNYIEALKFKTKAKLAEELGSEKLNGQEAREKIQEILGSSGKHFKTIAETEATKTRNLGRICKFQKVAADSGVLDPLVAFLVVKDNVTCQDCIKNHLIDGVNPKIMRLSEVKVSYLTKAERHEGRCSVSGQHPNCRCVLTYIPSFHGYVNGKLKYMSMDYDALAEQKKITG